MGGSSLQALSLEKGLTIFSEQLRKNNVEHFVFFGTLLGIVRGNEPIAGDDDVDFYVNRLHYATVQSLLVSLGLEVDYNTPPNHTNWFIQINGVIDGIEIRVDFYFYDSKSDKDYLLEPWNFGGQVKNKASILRVPKPLVFPLVTAFCKGVSINLPKHAEILCEFLYGWDWQTPLKKGADYQVAMVGGRPLRLRSENGKASILP